MDYENQLIDLAETYIVTGECDEKIFQRLEEHFLGDGSAASHLLNKIRVSRILDENSKERENLNKSLEKVF